MGLLSGGTPLSWEETKKHAKFLRRMGVKQFLATVHREKNRKKDSFKWGDEIEFSLVVLDSEKQRAQLSLLGPTVLPILQQPEHDDPENHLTKWMPEYARYMVEGTPGAKPFDGIISNLFLVEENMKLRRQQLYDVLKTIPGGEHVFPLCLSAFPRVGCPGFTVPETKPDPKSSMLKSLYLSDDVVVQLHENPRFMSIARNLREKRGQECKVNIPIFHDVKTPNPFQEELPCEGEQLDCIHLDTIGFGSGCCSLQVTFQSADCDESRHLYDQLAVVGPVMLAVTAASPIYRGYLSEIDCHWQVLGGTLDERTPEELEAKYRLRWSSIESYLSTADYCDQDVHYDETAFQVLRDGGVDDILARHVAYIFSRDPVVLLEEQLQEDEQGSSLWENMTSSNWQSVRFKTPHAHDDCGWRVEFRTMELQLTDPENAAFAVFMMLLAKAILSLKPRWLIPISKLDENLEKAQVRDAVNKEKFYFQKNFFPSPGSPQQDNIALMDANAIINGKDGCFGLIPLVRQYVEDIMIESNVRLAIEEIFKFVSRKASGELLTTSTWLRQFVTTHPDYKQDSVVSDRITFDLVSKMKLLSEGQEACPELTGGLDFAKYKMAAKP